VDTPNNAEGIEAFFSRSIGVFRDAPDDAAGLRQALLTYLRLGKTGGFSQSELIDFLGVSSPSILESAGLGESRQNLLMSILGDISEAEIQK
jgi:predicted XRE-type DNA-binding protein